MLTSSMAPCEAKRAAVTAREAISTGMNMSTDARDSSAVGEDPKYTPPVGCNCPALKKVFQDSSMTGQREYTCPGMCAAGPADCAMHAFGHVLRSFQTDEKILESGFGKKLSNGATI